ncbi:MAG: L-aspartate oxidase [Planctomycetota bacterium]|jgi:L-aspartate oxidase
MEERFLVDVDLRPVPTLTPDVLVIGGGVAGLRAAIAAASGGASVIVLMKGAPSDSNTAHAQGGVSAALGPDDDPQLHLADTIDAGAGLTDESAARRLVTEGPGRVRELIDWGAQFDRGPDGSLSLTREGAHCRDRILHAHGDATGLEFSRALVARAEADPGIMLMPGHYVIDLLHAGARVWGALATGNGNGKRRLVRVEAGATVLATGGAGRLYRETTNPPVATGDGIALAYRAGAGLADLEFMQFHPTALYVAGAPRLLISEAVRGEGAYLLNVKRERFMPDLHPMAELAPRDVVSAAIVEEMARTESPHVYLDLGHIDPSLVARRFPQIAEGCAVYGFDIARDLIPVRPGAHYMMGGVVTDLEGRTSVAGFYAAGEAACTGLHGANRLASNSLLEGLVFGEAAGRLAAEEARAAGARRFPLARLSRVLPERRVKVDLADLRQSLQALMNRSAGVFREGADLASAARTLGHWREYLMPARFADAAGFELQNMFVAATLVVRGALTRQESRGAHRRRDFPERDDERWKRRIVQSVGEYSE